MLVRTVFEIFSAAALIAGIFCEQKIAELERRIISKVFRSKKMMGQNGTNRALQTGISPLPLSRVIIRSGLPNASGEDTKYSVFKGFLE